MASGGKIVGIGPFIGGLNTHDDPTAVDDKELVEALNVELDYDGSLKSRPPIVNSGVTMPLGATGNIKLLGYFFANGNVPYLIGSDGLSSTYYFDGAWHLITATFAATAMAQFDSKAWLLAGTSEADPGGYWTPAGGFVADANMPHGTVLIAHKFRLWVAPGLMAPANSTRLYYSNVLGQPTFWPVAPSFIDIGAGDGQDIVQVVVYYNNLLIFRSTSIYSFQFSSDITAGIISQVVPGVGLDNAAALVVSESSIYFTFEFRAYVFINNRVQTINDKVPFSAVSQAGMYLSSTVSLFNQRVIFSYFDTMFVYNIRTQTWTRWRSTVNGPIGKIIPLEGPSAFPTAVCHSSGSVASGGGRTAKTLTITDGLTTAAENFQCVIQTKNFNYDQSSKYKRLFWWGADAVFHGALTAIASPIVFSGAVTWGQLLTKTWGQLLSFTWGQPATPSLSVSTVMNTSGSGSTRKFIKLNKGLRFRQINYQLMFTTDGSLNSAPVRLFSLTTFVSLKETASKSVS